jgi:O-6-methylguanine DNA methyltransferase
MIFLDALKTLPLCPKLCKKSKNSYGLYSFHTPLGWATLGHDQVRIFSLTFTDDKPLLPHEIRPQYPEALVLCPEGTVFQKKVWAALFSYNTYSGILSYLDLAQHIGSPKAARAVGQALGKNPISYLIPCHKVIHCDGSLGGFAWGGALKKRMLIYDQAH